VRGARTTRLRASPGRTRTLAFTAQPLAFTARTQDDLARCVVMLTREFTETAKVDGEDVELWLRSPGRRRPRPKLARHVGSAFLVATETGGFLVTAAHVARRMDAETTVSCGGRGGRRTSLRLADLIATRARRPSWVLHPRADVAVARIPDPPPVLRGRFLAAELLATESVPPRALQLLIVGFPLGLTSERRFAPMTKRAQVASGLVRFGTDETAPADFFLLDQPTMGGSSGGPVFIAPQVQFDVAGRMSIVRPRCVGLVSQTISDEAGGQFAAIVPARAIRRMLQRARASRRR